MLMCRSQNNYFFGLAIAFLSLFTFGCENNKVAQCEQIFQIARDVNQGDRTASYIDTEASLDVTKWLQAASRFDRAADNLTALNIDYSQLIDYQNQLARVYRIYSQATYDAVRARENKNFAALKSARSDAAKAGTIQQELIQKINNFCVQGN